MIAMKGISEAIDDISAITSYSSTSQDDNNDDNDNSNDSNIFNELSTVVRQHSANRLSSFSFSSSLPSSLSSLS